MQELTNTNFKSAWSLFADALAAEAGECRLSHRAFSLPKFICFLVNPSGDSQHGENRLPTQPSQEGGGVQNIGTTQDAADHALSFFKFIDS